MLLYIYGMQHFRPLCSRRYLLRFGTARFQSEELVQVWIPSDGVPSYIYTSDIKVSFLSNELWRSGLSIWKFWENVLAIPIWIRINICFKSDYRDDVVFTVLGWYFYQKSKSKGGQVIMKNPKKIQVEKKRKGLTGVRTQAYGMFGR